jgi:hypothetical protein
MGYAGDDGASPRPPTVGLSNRAEGAFVKRPRMSLRVLLIAVAVFASLLGWERRLARTIQAPDLVAVEVRPALPGRPITGEHLVRPDGRVSLGYYGKVSLAGLTPGEAASRIAGHLRPYVSDEPQRVRVWVATKNSPPTGSRERSGMSAARCPDS